MRKAISLFLALVLTVSLLCAFIVTAAADNRNTPDGRWLNANLEGNVTDDTPAALKDDFYLSVNKAWLLGTQIPDGEASVSAIADIGKQVKDLLLSLVKDDSLTGHDAELVHKLYALMDMDYRNAQGVKPLADGMEAIAKIDSLDSLMAYLCSEENLMRILAGPFIINVWPDERDTTAYITTIDPQNLFLITPEEYTQRTDLGDEAYADLRKHMLYLLPRVGFTEEEAQETLDRAIAWEALMAPYMQAEPAPEEGVQYDYTPEELKALAGRFPVMDILAISGFDSAKRYLVSNPAFVAALPMIYTEENVPLVRDWLRVTLARSSFRYLDEEVYRIDMSETAEKLGIRGEIDADRTALGDILDLLPVPLDNLYISAVRDEKKKADITALVDEILAGYRGMLETVDWLSVETRAAVIEKLDNMHTNLVYPDQTQDWSGLDFAGPEEGGSLLEAQFAISDFRMRLKAARMDQPANRRQWDQLSCQADTVNCQYETSNSFCITAALTSGDLYNDSLTYEQKLAGIGFVIAHEISHAFDTTGLEYNKDGVRTDWWTPEDKASFNERTDRLAAWLDGFIPLEGIHCDGKRLCREVIADMTAMKCLLSIAAQKADFDYDAFFRYFAVCLRELDTWEYCNDMVTNDSHALPYLRVNAILAQYGQFFDFYGIQEGDRMYLAPEDRVAVW